jgi:hypothetical protein
MRLILAVTLLAAALSTAASQQAPLGFDCEEDSVKKLADKGAWAPLHRTEVARRLALVRAAGKWGALADSLRDIFAARPADFNGIAPEQRKALEAELDTLRDELADAERDPTAYRLGRISASRFQLAFDMGPPVTYTLFNGRTSDKIVLRDASPPMTRRSVCWLAFAAADVAAQARMRSLTDVAAALHKLDTRWDNFMNHGYSMLPHEVLVNGITNRAFNGLFNRGPLEPPLAQVIFAHPSAATQIVSSSFRTLRGAHREDVLALEPVGLVGYFSEYRRYAGVSWLVTFPSAGRMGFGGMLHVSRFGHVAYVRRPVDPDGVHRNGFLMSLDAYRFVTGAADKWKKLKAGAITACESDKKVCADQLLKGSKL